MPCVYVFINTEKGFRKSVLKKLRKLHGLKEVYLVNGVYDILVKMNVDSIDELKEIIARSIRLQDKVMSTLTMMVIEKKSDDAHSNKKAIKIHANPIANNQGAHAL